MQKSDIRKEMGILYKMPANKIEIVTVPELQYIMCDGHDDPNNSALFQSAVEALFTLSYTIKFMVKKGPLQLDYGVMPLEGLWWTDDMVFSMEDRTAWKWTLMVLQPGFITREMYTEAIAQVTKKKNLPMLPALRMESMHEGTCAQILHTGPYSEEPATIARMHKYIEDNGYKLRDKHREIYLNDFRKTAPERLKTILRQPIDSIINN